MRAPKNKAPRLEGALPKLINVATCNQLVINRCVDSIDKAFAAQAAKALPDNKGEL